MPAQYIYTHSTGSNVDLSARVRAYRTSMSANAEEGSTAISTIIVDDEESGIDIRGLRQFDWKESSESSNSQIIFRGWTADRDISRGPFKVQRSRQWSVNISDLNSALNRRIMRGADANRPAETDVARIQWAVSTTELNILTDSTYISTAAPTAMDANDYRNQRVFDIIDDCAQQSGKNYFLILNELFSPPKLGLFYDYAGSTAYSSTVRLTNVLADVDSTTTYAVLNDVTKLNRDPSRVYPTVIVPYNGGDVYLNDPSISANFFPRDTMAPAVNVHSASVARTRGLRYLADISTEEDRITTGYIVPLARVNRLREGHTFQAKFSHLPGYTDWTWLRALKRTVTAISEEFYKVELECSPAAASAVAATCTNIVAGLQTYNSGYIDCGAPGCNTSKTFNVNTVPSAYPAVMITNAGMLNTFEPGATSVSVAAPWTNIGNWANGGNFLAETAYKAISSGTAGNEVISFSPRVFAQGMVGIALPTAATSPVQSVTLFGSAATISLTSTPTPGNILVLTRAVLQTGGSFDTGIAPTGFEQAIALGIWDSGVSHEWMDICTRCVTTGDGKDYGIAAFGSPQAQFTTLSEWALT